MRIKKAVLSAGRKRICLLAGVILLLASLAGIVFSFPSVTESSPLTLYSCQLEADASYRVHLHPNALYESEWLEEGGVYAEALTDYIKVHFWALFQGSGAADVEGTYRIFAVTEGYQVGTESEQIVYRKEFPLKEGTFPSAKNGKTKVEEVLDIQPAIYREYGIQAQQILQANVSYRSYLIFSGSLEAKTAHGDKKQDFSYLLTLPGGSGTSLYQITKSAPIFKKDVIQEPGEPVKSVDAVRATMVAAAGLVGLGLLIFSFFFTRLPDRKEMWRIRMKEILRKYGSRMSRLEELPDFTGLNCVRLADMDSLIALAEEMRRPVLYRPDEEELPQDGTFYCFEEGELYLFRLSEEATTLVTDKSAESDSK